VPVVGVSESQVVDAAGSLSDVYEITFTISGQPGSFNVTIPKTGDAVADAEAAIGAVAQQVNAIYGINV
jgi:hypothetical protein